MITGYHSGTVILLRFFISIFVATSTSRRLSDPPATLTQLTHAGQCWSAQRLPSCRSSRPCPRDTVVRARDNSFTLHRFRLCRSLATYSLSHTLLLSLSLTCYLYYIFRFFFSTSFSVGPRSEGLAQPSPRHTYTR